MISAAYIPPNPWVWAANDPQGLTLSISVPWNTATRALQNATVTRATGCTLGHVYIGLGADGTPNTAPSAYAVPVGSSNVNANTLGHNGLNTIDDVTKLQVTAGP